MRPIFRTLAVLALASLVAAPAAQAEDVVTPADLAGTWQWQQSVGSVAGVTRTAAEQGALVQIEFSEDFKLRVTRDGVLSVGTYELMEGPLGGQEIRLLLEDPNRGAFPALTLDMGISLSLDRLRLDEPCCDLWSHTFTFEAAGLLPVLPVSLGEFKLLWVGDTRR